MENAAPSGLASQGFELDLSPGSFGALRDSTDVLGDTEALGERMTGDGYLYLPGYLDRGPVMEARKSVTNRLAREGLTDPDHPASGRAASPSAA